MPAEPSADSLAGQLVGGRYRLLRQVGKGGMGVVYEAEHVGLDKRVAVKFLLDRFTDDPEVIERFHREARTASRIGHDNIIDVTDVGHEEARRPYIVMELLDGLDLAAVLSRSGPMPAARAIHVIRQILRGLGAAHDKGIVHRDMKPENVFVIPRGGDPDFVKIMDFGISKVIAANDSKVRLTQTGAVIGTPIYMAPEQALANGEVDHRADLYAVGVMAFELLAGRPPFLATSYLGLVTQHLNTAPPNLAQFRPDLEPRLVAAVMRALEKDPDRRFASAAEMARALPLEATLRELDAAATLGDTDGVRMITEGARAAAPARPGTADVSTAERRSRRRTALWVVGGAVLVAAGMIAVALATRDHPREARSSGGVAEPARDAPLRPEVVSLGKLDVRSSPAGAQVILDGEPRGLTPLLLSGVPAGKHQLRLEKGGHLTVAVDVVVNGGSVDRVDETLPPVDPPAERPVERPAERPPPEKVARPADKRKERPAVAAPKSEQPPIDEPAPKERPAEPAAGERPAEKRPPKKTGRPGQKPNPYD